MREAGQLAAEVLELIGQYVVPASAPASWTKSAMIILSMYRRRFPPASATAAFLNRSAPPSTRWSVTASPREKILKNGDIINIDVTVIKDGWHGDTSKMFAVGNMLPTPSA